MREEIYTKYDEKYSYFRWICLISPLRTIEIKLITIEIVFYLANDKYYKNN